MIPSAEQPDATLIEYLRRNDLAALGILFDRYSPQLYRTALAILHDSAAAEDVVQDCFLRLHQYADRIDTELPLIPWLYRVTVNLSYTWVTRRQKRRVSLEALVDQLMSPPSQSPDQMAEHIDIQQRVREAVATLPMNQRVVIVLHYMNGMNVEEIADITHCPVGTIKSRLYYGREALRHRLGDYAESTGLAHGFAGLTG
jgi:RNA polymerase sigma-70 factor (ECF subfamily)